MQSLVVGHRSSAKNHDQQNREARLSAVSIIAQSRTPRSLPPATISAPHSASPLSSKFRQLEMRCSLQPAIAQYLFHSRFRSRRLQARFSAFVPPTAVPSPNQL